MLLRRRGRKPRQRIDALAQVIGDRLPVFESGKGCEWDRRSDRNRESGPDARLHLVENERKPEGEAHVTRDLEEAAVLAAKPDRNDRRL